MLIAIWECAHLKITAYMSGSPGYPYVSPLLNISAWHRDTGHKMTSHMKGKGQRTKENNLLRENGDHSRKNTLKTKYYQYASWRHYEGYDET